MSEQPSTPQEIERAAREAVRGEMTPPEEEAGGWGPYIVVGVGAVLLGGLLYLTSAPCALPRLKVIAAGLGGEMQGTGPICTTTEQDCCCSWRAASGCASSFTACDGADLDTYREMSDCTDMNF